MQTQVKPSIRTQRGYMRHRMAAIIPNQYVYIPHDPSEEFSRLFATYGLTLGELYYYAMDTDTPYCYGASLETDANHIPLGLVCAADLGDRYDLACVCFDRQNGAERLLALLPEEITNDLFWGTYDGETLLIVDRWETVAEIGAYAKGLPTYAARLDEVGDHDVLDTLCPDQWGFGDEYTTCSNCATVIRTSPEHYGWRAMFWLTDGEILCAECTRDAADEYLGAACWNHKFAVNPSLVDPSDHGFAKLEYRYETGLHQGQNDDPRALLRILSPLRTKVDVLYTYESGQFDVQFYLWARWSESYRETQEENGTPLLDDLAADLVASALASYTMPSMGPSDHAMAALRSGALSTMHQSDLQ